MEIMKLMARDMTAEKYKNLTKILRYYIQAR